MNGQSERPKWAAEMSGFWNDSPNRMSVPGGSSLELLGPGIQENNTHYLSTFDNTR